MILEYIKILYGQIKFVKCTSTNKSSYKQISVPTRLTIKFVKIREPVLDLLPKHQELSSTNLHIRKCENIYDL